MRDHAFDSSHKTKYKVIQQHNERLCFLLTDKFSDTRWIEDWLNEMQKTDSLPRVPLKGIYFLCGNNNAVARFNPFT